MKYETKSFSSFQSKKFAGRFLVPGVVGKTPRMKVNGEKRHQKACNKAWRKFLKIWNKKKWMLLWQGKAILKSIFQLVMRATSEYPTYPTWLLSQFVSGWKQTILLEVEHRSGIVFVTITWTRMWLSGCWTIGDFMFTSEALARK